jgi:hypothetical protein
MEEMWHAGLPIRRPMPGNQTIRLPALLRRRETVDFAMAEPPARRASEMSHDGALDRAVELRTLTVKSAGTQEANTFAANHAHP